MKVWLFTLGIPNRDIIILGTRAEAKTTLGVCSTAVSDDGGAMSPARFLGSLFKKGRRSLQFLIRLMTTLAECAPKWQSGGGFDGKSRDGRALCQNAVNH